MTDERVRLTAKWPVLNVKIVGDYAVLYDEHGKHIGSIIRRHLDHWYDEA